MNTPATILIRAKKMGKPAFFRWLHNNHQYDYLMKAARELDKASFTPFFV